VLSKKGNLPQKINIVIFWNYLKTVFLKKAHGFQGGLIEKERREKK